VLKVAEELPDWTMALALAAAGWEQKMKRAAMLAEFLEPLLRHSAVLDQQAAVRPAKWPQPARVTSPQKIASVLRL